MFKKFALVALAAGILTGCGKAPLTGVERLSKPGVIFTNQFSQDLNDHKYDGELAAARQAIAGELTKQGLEVPAELATRHLAATSSAKVTSVKVVTAQGPNGGKAGAVDVKGPNGGEVAAAGVKGPNGGAAGVVAAKGPDGAAVVAAGAKDGKGNAVVAGAAKDGNGAGVAYEGVKGANGGAAGQWVATDGQGGAVWGAAAKDPQGNAIGATVLTKDGKVMAQRWIKGANGNALLESAVWDPKTHLLVYSITALINGKPITATALLIV